MKMAKWEAEEVRQVAEITKGIDCFIVPRRRTPGIGRLTIDLSQAELLRNNLCEGSFFIRQMYQALNFNEDQPFNWRLEHKLVQFLVLNRYCPDSVPVTRGLGLQTQYWGPEAIRRKLSEEFPGGFWIKEALGCSSRENGKSDRTEEVLGRIESGDLAFDAPASVLDETWIVQEKIPIAVEYRVHSLEDQVLDDLTFWRYKNGDPPLEEARHLNTYVQSILDRMPAAVVANSLCGWDIALTEQGSFIVVEVNFSGFHPVRPRGFHCSGFFQDRKWGPKSIAHLIQFIERIDGVTIVINSNVGCDSEDSGFYSEIELWRQQIA
jgi:hypothetical protein